MASNTVKSTYRPKQSQEAYVPDFTLEPDLDYTAPYPCGVCRVEFRSRYALGTHKHKKRSA